MNIKTFLIPSTIPLLMAVFAAGCTPGAHETQPVPREILPEGLKDCKFYRLDYSNGGGMTVVRCPHSSTTTSYTSGKTTVNNTIVDGGVDARIELNRKIGEVIERAEAEITQLKQESLK